MFGLRGAVVGVVAMAALGLQITAPPPAGAVDQSSISVTVTVTSFKELQDPDPAVFQGNGDYYAVVKIGENDWVSNVDDVIDGPDPDEADYTITPDWEFTADVDPCANGGDFEVRVQIWDQESHLSRAR